MKQLLASLLLLICLPCLAQNEIGSYPTAHSLTGAERLIGDQSGKTRNITPALIGVYTGGTVNQFPVQLFGAKCDGVTNDSAAFQSAIAAAVNAGGGAVTVPTAVCAIGTALTVNNSRIVFQAQHYGDGDHDVGSNDLGAVLKWTGSAGGTILTIAAVAGASNQALYGAGVQGLTFDCNNSAAIGLELESLKGGYYNFYYLECTTAGLDTVPVSSLGEASDVQGLDIVVHGRTLLSTGVGVRMSGVTGHNTSFDRIRDSQVLYKNGIGAYLRNTDNVFLSNVQMTQAAGGSAVGLDLGCDSSGSANSIYLHGVSWGAGGALIEGTGTCTTAVKNVKIDGQDLSNNIPAATQGTGVTGVVTNKENGHSVGAALQNAAFGESDANVANAETACAGSSVSVCLYNTSSNHATLTDGTNTFGLNIDGSGNLRVTHPAGSGNVKLNVGLLIGNNILCTAGAPSVTSGGGSSPSVQGTNGCAFQVTEGSGSPGTALTVSIGTATTGWACHADDVTTTSVTAHQTGSTTSGATITFSSAPTAADKIVFNCGAF